MIKRLTIILLLFLVSQANAQIVIGSNYSFMLPFGAKKQFHGVQLLIEKPLNERVSYYGYLTYYFNQKLIQPDMYYANAIQPDVDPPGIDLGALSKYSMVGVSFGRRNYWLNPIDQGFSLYGGTTLNLRFGFAQSRPEAYDTENYEIVNYNTEDIQGKGTVFSLGAGLSGGMQYTINRFGTVYMDVAFEYSILNYPTSNAAANAYKDMGSPLNFYVGIGYKKIIFWNRGE